METYTFSPKKAPEFIYTVKADFLTKVPNPEECSNHELWDQHAIFQYLHNPSGPALVNTASKDKDGKPKEVFFLNGKKVSDDERDKIIYSNNFKKDIRDALKD